MRRTPLARSSWQNIDENTPHRETLTTAGDTPVWGPPPDIVPTCIDTDLQIDAS